MTTAYGLEGRLVADLLSANLPELHDFAIEALGAQVDLEEDALSLGCPTILVAVTGLQLGSSHGSQVHMGCVAVVPGSDQVLRRQRALDALVAIREWIAATGQPYLPTSIRPERFHPVAIAGLFLETYG